MTMARLYTNGKSVVDQAFRGVMKSTFFSEGHGGVNDIRKLLEFHKIMSNRDKCKLLVSESQPFNISSVEEDDKWSVISGNFKSPFADHMPGFLPPESVTSTFQFCVPKVWKSDDKPVSVHLAGTGDHNFWRRRRFMARALMEDYGIASLLVENPFYGSRKPAQQQRSNLRFVTDIFVMGGGLILESMAILRWLENHNFGPLCLTGISMGGHMASLAATNWHKPIPLVPCLSWTSASGVFTRGVMSGAVNWKSLEKEIKSNSVFRDDLMNQLSNFTFDWQEDAISAARRDERIKLFSRINSISSKAVSKVMESLGLSRLISSTSKFFPLKPTPNSSLQYDPGKTSFPIDRFSFLEKVQGRSGGMSRNFDTEFNLKGVKVGKDLKSSSLGEIVNSNERADRLITIEFMRRIMDHFTHVANFSVPVDPELIIVVVARDDAYVLREGITPVDEIWRGCEIRALDAGHVTACLWKRRNFREAINDAINKYREKYNLDGTPRRASIQ